MHGYLGCSQDLSVMKNSILSLCIIIFLLSGGIYRSGVTELYGNIVLNLLS